MFQPAAYEAELLNKRISVNVMKYKKDWKEKVNAIFEDATLHISRGKKYSGCKQVAKTEYIQNILAIFLLKCSFYKELILVANGNNYKTHRIYYIDAMETYGRGLRS